MYLLLLVLFFCVLHNFHKKIFIELKYYIILSYLLNIHFFLKKLSASDHNTEVNFLSQHANKKKYMHKRGPSTHIVSVTTLGCNI